MSCRDYIKKEIAILMAAGKGTRMQPLTKKRAKPLLPVLGKPMIETVIEGLRLRGVENIYIVVGYLGSQFEYLKEKYPNIVLVFNKEYEEKNNISSIYAVRRVLGQCNCFICEADLYIMNATIFQADLQHSCYFGKMVEGYSDDWAFSVQNGRITRIGKGGEDSYNMVGISYFLQEDAQELRNAIERSYSQPGHEGLFWDEVVDTLLQKIDIRLQPIRGNELLELDTVSEIAAIDSNYIKEK